MLPKRERLTAPEVREILQKGRLARGGAVSARFVSCSGRKAAVVVSAKVVRGAVNRNRIRRRVYGALQTLPRGVCAVFFVRSADIAAADVEQLCLKLS